MFTTRFLTAALVTFLLHSCGVTAFSTPKHALQSSSTQLSLFGGLADAFKNDETLSKPQNAGLSGGPKFNENVTVNGKKVQGAVQGQKLTAVANKARVKIPVNCQKGDCGTCTVLLNGRKVKACQTPLPASKSAIQTL